MQPEYMTMSMAWEQSCRQVVQQPVENYILLPHEYKKTPGSQQA